MANVFRRFYEELYVSKDSTKATSNSTFQAKNKTKLIKVTFDEVSTALNKLKNGKCKDTKHVTVEIIKHAGANTKRIIANICNDILSGG